MIEEQKLVEIEIKDLVSKVKEMFASGYRLVQIGVTKVEGYEINYSFDKAYEFVNLRIKLLSSDIVVPSVSGVYWNAFLYENEIQDLFGLKIEGIAVDYKGKFYRTAVKTPFGDTK